MSFSASLSAEIDEYILNCSSNSCQVVTLEGYNADAVILVQINLDASNHTVNVVAINRCRKRSSSVSATTTIPAMVNDSNALMCSNEQDPGTIRAMVDDSSTLGSSEQDRGRITAMVNDSGSSEQVPGE